MGRKTNEIIYFTNIGKMWDIKSTKEHWDSVHKTRSQNFIKKLPFLQWLQSYDFFNICKKYIKNYKNVFEIGCAPGNFLINFAQKFNLEANGIEYSDEWIKKTQENFKKNNIEANIIYWDFFDEKFLNSNKEKYDIVYSLGFIEHFDHPETVIDRHFSLAKQWGLIIICIPNIAYINKALTPKKILNIHNLSIMNISTLKKIFAKHKIAKIWYYWWLFNMWLFFYDNFILEKIRFFMFLLQRIILDPILIVLYKLGLRVWNKYTSPWIIIICHK